MFFATAIANYAMSKPFLLPCCKPVVIQLQAYCAVAMGRGRELTGALLVMTNVRVDTRNCFTLKMSQIAMWQCDLQCDLHDRPSQNVKQTRRTVVSRFPTARVHQPISWEMLDVRVHTNYDTQA